MISDILSEACVGIDEYLNDNTFSSCYTEEIKEEILAVKTIMNALRIKLDTPPDPEFLALISEIVENVNNLSSEIQMVKKELETMYD